MYLKNGSPALKHLTTDLYQDADARSFFPSKTNFGAQRVVETLSDMWG